MPDNRFLQSGKTVYDYLTPPVASWVDACVQTQRDEISVAVPKMEGALSLVSDAISDVLRAMPVVTDASYPRCAVKDVSEAVLNITLQRYQGLERNLIPSDAWIRADTEAAINEGLKRAGTAGRGRFDRGSRIGS